MRPPRHSQRKPVAVGFQPEIEQPLRLAFRLRYVAHHILVQPHRNDMGVDVRDESIFVFTAGGILYDVLVRFFLLIFFFTFFHISYVTRRKDNAFLTPIVLSNLPCSEICRHPTPTEPCASPRRKHALPSALTNGKATLPARRHTARSAQG